MVTFPDYESAGENPYAIKESTRLMESRELLEWVERRIIRLGGVLAKSLTEEIVIPPPLEIPTRTPSGALVRTRGKYKKLKCGHMILRRKGVYPLRCKDCQKHFDERVYLMKRHMK